MNVLPPARLRKPLKRVGPRGAGEFAQIEWDEALAIATARPGHIRATDPNSLAFFTGRDQSQSLTATSRRCSERGTSPRMAGSAR